MALRAQAALEFFFLIAFALILASWLVFSAEGHLRQQSEISRVALARSSLDAAASAINYVLLAGNGSTLLREVFVPERALCFVYNSSAQALVCDVDGVRISSRVQGFVNVSNCTQRGWLLLRIKAVDDAASLICGALA